MTINRAAGVRNAAKNVDAFIGSAPDAGRKGVIRGKKEQITLTISPDLLAKVDALASRMGQSRAALINRAIYELAERVAS
jgi:Ribbon-helix-helix protein, copG family